MRDDAWGETIGEKNDFKRFARKGFKLRVIGSFLLVFFECLVSESTMVSTWWRSLSVSLTSHSNRVAEFVIHQRGRTPSSTRALHSTPSHLPSAESIICCDSTTQLENSRGLSIREEPCRDNSEHARRRTDKCHERWKWCTYNIIHHTQQVQTRNFIDHRKND